MNIVLLNQDWLKLELEQLGHKVVTASWLSNHLMITVPWGSNAEEFLLQVRNYFEPDMLIYYDNSSLPTIFNIEDIKIPKIFFSVDTFHHLSWHGEFARQFNLTLVAQKDYVEKLREKAGLDVNIEWFPLWVAQSYEPKEEKIYDVSFRGTLDEKLHPDRLEFFKRIAREVNIDYGGGPIADVYPRSKIVINQAVKKDINFRNFEALLGGALLLTPNVGNGIEEIFADRVNCVFYEDGNAEDAIAKIKYYLEHEEERKSIAEAGFKLACDKYTQKAAAARLIPKFEKVSTEEPIYDVISGFVIQIFVIRALWQTLRQENDENYMYPLEKSLNHLQKLVNRCDVSENIRSDLETTIVIADMICSDILDEYSYDLWRQSLVEKFSNISFVNLLDIAYDNASITTELKEAAFSQISNVRYSLVQQLLNVT